MKKNLKRRFLTGVAAIALVAPLVLGGFNTNRVHADDSAAAHEENLIHSGQLGNGLLGTVNPTSGSSSSNPNTNSNNGNPMTPQQKKAYLATRKAAMANLNKKLRALQKKQLAKIKAKMMKTAQPMFVVQGNEVYTIMVDLVKGNRVQPVPETQKRFASVRRFKKIDARGIQQARVMAIRASRIRNKRTRARRLKKAQALFTKYNRIARMPTKKQAEAMAKKAAQKKNRKNVKNQKTNRRIRKGRKGRRTRRTRQTRRNRNRRVKRTNDRVKLNRRIRKTPRHKRNQRTHRGKTFTVKINGRRETLLNSEFRRGNWKAARKSGFAKGPVLQGIYTMFNRYQPNNRRAVLPSNYRIYQVNANQISANHPLKRATVWLVGRKTNNVKKINSMKQDYYYDSNDHGWLNIGK